MSPTMADHANPDIAVNPDRAARDLSQPNPELVQPEDYTDFTFFSGTKQPLFLIHDGGGTVYSYHCLGRLHRFVYAIRNPNFFTGDIFPGGIPQMAELYACMIRDCCAQGDFPAARNPDSSVDILLGGWSLGGLLSLAVAKLLADDPGVRVTGMIMVDSVCPVRAQRNAQQGGLDRSWVTKSWHPDPPASRNEMLSQRCMAVSRKMVSEWTLPRFETHEARPPIVMIKAKHKIPVRTEPAKKEGEGEEAAAGETQTPASDNANNGDNGTPPAVHTLDVVRDNKTLGWDDYENGMLLRVIETDGHHFDLFKDHRVSGTTMALRKALNTLDE